MFVVRGQVINLLLDYPDASYVKIGSIVSCSRQRVHQLAKEAGLTRKQKKPPHCRDDITVERVLKLYHTDGLLIKEIAQTLGCTNSTVTRRLREAGITARKCLSRSMRLRPRSFSHRRDDITVEQSGSEGRKANAC